MKGRPVESLNQHYHNTRPGYTIQVATKNLYDMNMIYAITDGPSHLGGCEFTPLYHMQGTLQIQNFLRHYRTQSDALKTIADSTSLGSTPI
eukprot:3653115-Ditylum_brightwellii.AAC.1